MLKLLTPANEKTLWRARRKARKRKRTGCTPDVVRWNCNNSDQVQADCSKWKREQDNNGGSDNDKTDNTMVAMLEKEDPSKNLRLPQEKPHKLPLGQLSLW